MCGRLVRRPHARDVDVDDGHVGENVGEAHVRVAIAQAIRPGPAPRISSQICADRPQNFFLT